MVVMNRWLLPVWLLLAATVMGEPVGASDSEAPIERLVVGTTMEVKRIDIDDYYFGILRGMLTHLGLIRLDENGAFEGELAERWQTEDGRIWTFTLKPGLLWHDGRPVTAADVKFSFDYLIEKIPVYRSHFNLFEAAEVLDERTIRVILTQSHPRFPVTLLVLRILPHHRFESVPDPLRFAGAEAAVGCGPFQFERFDRASGTISFRAFDRYYRGTPKVKRVIIRLFKNPDTMILAFRNGEIDLPYQYAAGIAPYLARPLLDDPGIRIHRLPNLGVPTAVFFNQKKPPLDNTDFRRALAFAIDYTELLKLFGGGYGSTPNGGFVPPGTEGFVETETLRHNPARARTILKGLGYVDRDGDGIRERDGRPTELELVLRSDIGGNLRLGQLLQEYFRVVGVRLHLKPVDMALFRTISDQDRSHGALLSRTTPWGMMMWAGCGSGYFDPRNIGWTVTDAPEFTATVDRMNRSLSIAEYSVAAAALQRYYARELPAVALYWDELIQPCRSHLHGWKISPIYGFLWEKTWFSLREENP